MNAQTKPMIGVVAIVAFAAFGYTSFFPFPRVEAQRILVVDNDEQQVPQQVPPEQVHMFNETSSVPQEVPPELVHMIELQSLDIPKEIPQEQVQMMNPQFPDIPKEVPADAFTPVTQ